MTDLPLLTDITPHARGLFQFESEKFASILKPGSSSELERIIIRCLQQYLNNPDFIEVQFIHESQDVIVDKKFEIQRLLQCEDLLDEINKLPYSMKISGVQTTEVEIQNLLTSYYKRDGDAITCNLYLTPSGNANCFKFHVDPQDVYVVQVMGEKLWSFPMEGISPLYNFTEVGTTANQNYSVLKQINLKSGQGLKVKRGIPHKAVNLSKVLSAHYSLSTFPLENIDFYNQLVGKLMTFETEYLDKLMCTPESIISDSHSIKNYLMHKMKGITLDSEIKLFLREHQIKNSLYAKSGRPYSTKQKQLLQTILKMK